LTIVIEDIYVKLLVDIGTDK